jgi:hypothetical protein
MSFRLKLARSNNLKLKVATRLPAQLSGGAGIEVTRANAAYTIDLHYGGIGEVTAIQADLEATTFLTQWETVGDEFSRISIANLKADIQATFNGYYQPLDATLTVLAALDNTAGLLTQTGADTFVRRTLTGTANEIDIANGTGAVGNPTASLPATLVLTGKTVTVDTQAQADNSTKAASTGYVRAAIAAVLSGVSAAFDTLSEIATELALKAYAATTITAGAGLTGGGDLSASRTIDVGAGTGIAVNANNVALADMAQSTIKGRAAGAGTGAPTDLSATQATAILNPFVGDGGSGGAKGLVPAPATGDATKFLRGDGTFVAIAGGGDMLAANNLSDVANVNTARQNLRAGVIGETIWFNQSYAPVDFLIEDGSSVSSATYALLFAVLVRSATVTISNAAPGVVTWTAHNLKTNDPVYFTTTGGLPAGLTASSGASFTTYYVKTVLGANTFTVSATPGGAVINTSSSGSGTHTAVNAPHGVVNTSLTNFNLPNSLGEFIRGWDVTRGIDTNRVLGSAQGQAIQSHAHSGIAGLFVPTSGASFIALLDFGTHGAGSFTLGSSGGGAETRPRNVAKLPCIRYR